jgi:hypothetical protein
VTGETVQRFQAVTSTRILSGPGTPSRPLPMSAIPGSRKPCRPAARPRLLVSNAAGGVAQLALDSTSEKQEASIYARERSEDGPVAIAP